MPSTLYAPMTTAQSCALLNVPAGVKSSSSANIFSYAFAGEYNLDKPVLIDALQPSRCISKRQALRLVLSLAGAFRRHSTVCLHLANDVLYPILSLSIYASDCRWTGTNIAYTAPELAHHFRVSKTECVVTAEEHLDTVFLATSGLGHKVDIVIFNDLLQSRALEPELGACNVCGRKHIDGFTYLHDLQRPRNPDYLVNLIQSIDADEIATLMPTSGTTGLPKMAARTHRANIVEARAVLDNNADKPYEVRRLYCTPIFHSFSMPEMVINSLRTGFPAYYMKRFDDTVFPRKIQEFGVTEIFAPPPMLLRLINNSIAHRQMQSLRNIYTGGAPLVPELRTRFLKLFPASDPPRITNVWGMTEGGWYATFKYPEVDATGSVGRPLPGYDVKIGIMPSAISDGDTKSGELWIRSPSLMSQYLQNESATDGIFPEPGWINTGDIGFIKDGKIYLDGRSKDLIKVNGWQVSPTEIENVLMQSPGVKDCAVVGVGNDVREHPLAFVVRYEGVDQLRRQRATVTSLRITLLENLARYKVSTCEFRFVDAIPKNLSGKILRNELRKMAMDDLCEQGSSSGEN